VYRSKNFYVRVTGDLALFTSPQSKAGGERTSYLVPTRQALTGIVDGVYFKPSIQNIVTEVKVMNRIQTEVHGIRNLLKNGGSDLSYISYLHNVEYLVKFHFIWNKARPDLQQDWISKKHEAIMTRSLDKGGRLDLFLGARECHATATGISEKEYKDSVSFYDEQEVDLGLMFHSFAYPINEKDSLRSYFTTIRMINGIIKFKAQSECEVENVLSAKGMGKRNDMKTVDEEFLEYEQWEKEGK